MKYLVLITLFISSSFVLAQEIDSTMLLLEQEFYQYDLPNSDSTYLDSVYKVETTSLGFIGGLGYNDGLTLEIGYGKSFFDIRESKSSFQSYYGGIEVLPNSNNDFMIAPKASIWIEEATYFTAVGLNLLYYTNFEGYTVRLRPEVGLGYKKIKLTYGYNASLLKGNLDLVNKHNVGLSYFLDTKPKEVKKTTYRGFLKEQKELYKSGNW